MAANVEVKIKLNDQASTGLKKIGKEAEQASTKSSKAAEAMAKKSSAAVEQSVSKSRSQYEKLASARTQLGVRSEKSVQNEIKQTEAAYNRLARSGAVSARELARAQDASIAKVRELKREINDLTKMQKAGQVAQNAATGATTAAAGAYAAKSVVDIPVRAYADLEAAQADLKVALMTKGGKVSAAYDDLNLQAVALGNKLPGTTKDFIASATALKEQGMPESAIVGGGLKAAAEFGVVAKMDQYQAATTLAKMREAYGLKGNELPEMANLMQKSKNAYGIAADDFRAVAQYAAPTYNQLGLTGAANAKDLLAVQGIAAGVGLENTSFGTNFAQMLQRTAVIDSRVNKHSPEAKEVKAILKEFGIEMSFFTKQGKFAGIENMFAQLEKLKPLSDQDRIKVLNKMFGIEAGRPAAIIAMQGVKGFKESQAKLDNQADMAPRIAKITSTLKSKEETTAGALENTLAAAAQPIGEVKKGVLDSVNSYLSNTVQPALKKDPSRGTDAIVGTSIVAANAATFGASAALTAAGVTGSGAAGAGALGLAAAGTTLSAVAAAGAVGYGAGKYAVNPAINFVDEKLGTGIGNTIGRVVSAYLAPFSAEARNNLVQDFKTQVSELGESAKGVSLNRSMALLLAPTSESARSFLMQDIKTLFSNPESAKNKGLGSSVASPLASTSQTAGTANTKGRTAVAPLSAQANIMLAPGLKTQYSSLKTHAKSETKTTAAAAGAGLGLGVGIGNTIGRTVSLILAPFSAELRNKLVQDFKTQYNSLMQSSKIDSNITVKLGPGLVLANQQTKVTGAVKSSVNTGNLRDGAMW